MGVGRHRIGLAPALGLDALAVHPCLLDQPGLHRGGTFVGETPIIGALPLTNGDILKGRGAGEVRGNLLNVVGGFGEFTPGGF